MDAESLIATEPFTAVLPVLLPSEAQYRCPDETHTISKSVHLARLAAFYPKCRHCQHRHDTGQISPAVVERIQCVEQQRAPQRSIFETEGIRGVYLNEMTPSIAGGIAGALASLLWDQVPLTARVELPSTKSVKRAGPMIVIGYDERPSSPALMAAVADSLRMMGCQVMDVGQVAKACFCFAVDHLQAAGGLYITGANHEVAWSGLDLFAEGALPVTADTGLEVVRQRWANGYSRPTRRAGFQRAFQASIPYEAGLWKHFHALRPLRIVAAIRPRAVRNTVRRLMAKLPCELFEVEAASAQTSPQPNAGLLSELGQRVVKRNAHLGIAIGEDGCACHFTDERGRSIAARQLTALLANDVLIEHPQADVCLESSAIESLRALLKTDRLVDAGNTCGSMSGCMRSTHAVFGGGDSPRYWHREAFPTCDGILTLARVLQALSRSDAAFSELLPSAAGPC